MNVGDRVRRAGVTWGDVVHGGVYVVRRVTAYNIWIEGSDRNYMRDSFEVIEEAPCKYAVAVIDRGTLRLCTHTGERGQDGEVFDSKQAAVEWAQGYSRQHRDIEYHLVPIRSVGLIMNGDLTEFN